MIKEMNDPPILIGSQGKEFPMMNLNETAARHGFCVDCVRESEELHGQMVEMHHEKTV